MLPLTLGITIYLKLQKVRVTSSLFFLIQVIPLFASMFENTSNVESPQGGASTQKESTIDKLVIKALK